tara:strand:- start:172 stop:1329 length:1158 start_codon:yes stop_codon:yes gene_type:complete
LNKRKNILVFIDWFLPGYKAGGPIRSMVNMIELLKDEFNFYVVTSDTDYTETQPYPGIEPNKWVKLEEYLEVCYLSQDRTSRSTVLKILKETDYDVVYINGLFSTYFSIMPLWCFSSKSRKIIVNPRGMAAPSAIGNKAIRKRFYLKLACMFGKYKNVLFHTSSPIESNQVKCIVGNATKLYEVENVPRVSFKSKNDRNVSKVKGSLKLITVARVSGEKNILYGLKRLKSVQGKVDYSIFGPLNELDYWQSCQEVIQQLPSNIRVQYKGALPYENIREELAKHHVMYLPTKGENYGHAIVEALCECVPVLISDQTIWTEKVNASEAFAALSLSDKALWQNALQKLVDLDGDGYSEMLSRLEQVNQALFNLEALKVRYKAMFNDAS